MREGRRRRALPAPLFYLTLLRTLYRASISIHSIHNIDKIRGSDMDTPMETMDT
jgi:hypothetical protein